LRRHVPAEVEDAGQQTILIPGGRQVMGNEQEHSLLILSDRSADQLKRAGQLSSSASLVGIPVGYWHGVCFGA
jgi:hypothetical protein